MKILVYCWLLLSVSTFAKKPETAPKVPFTGMTNISWIGFDNQVVSSPIPLGVVNMSAPSPFVFPKKVQSQTAFYQEVVLVNPTFKPVPPVRQSPTKGNWFLRRQVLSVKDGKTTVLQTSKLAINKNAEATDKADQMIPFSATHIEYRLGRTEKKIGPAAPGKLPKATTIEVFPNDAVRIAIPMSWITGNTCQVKVGVIRPIPCEFQTVKFQILGKSGKLLYETTELKGVPIKIDETEAKKTEGPFVTFEAKWIVKRIHKPNYTVKKGYQVAWGQSGSDFNMEVDNHSLLASGLQLDATIGKEFTIPVELRIGSKSGGFSQSIRELLLENDVTKTKFLTTTQAPAAPRSDCYIQLNW
jgi:hypothetical protein